MIGSTKKAEQVPNSVLILTVQALVFALSRPEACGLTIRYLAGAGNKTWPASHRWRLIW